MISTDGVLYLGMTCGDNSFNVDSRKGNGWQKIREGNSDDRTEEGAVCNSSHYCVK